MKTNHGKYRNKHGKCSYFGLIDLFTHVPLERLLVAYMYIAFFIKTCNLEINYLKKVENDAEGSDVLQLPPLPLSFR